MNDKEITLTLMASEVNTLLLTLQEVPFRISAPLIAKIKQQGDAQMSEQKPEESNG